MLGLCLTSGLKKGFESEGIGNKRGRHVAKIICSVIKGMVIRLKPRVCQQEANERWGKSRKDPFHHGLCSSSNSKKGHDDKTFPQTSAILLLSFFLSLSLCLFQDCSPKPLIEKIKMRTGTNQKSTEDKDYQRLKQS